MHRSILYGAWTTYFASTAATGFDGSIVSPTSREVPLIQYIPADFPATVAISSHVACRQYLLIFLNLNIGRCHPPKSFHRMKGVQSHEAKACEGNEKQFCDATFLCLIDQPYWGCSAQFLRSAFAGRMKFFCPAGGTLSFVRNDLNDKRSAVCLKDNGQPMLPRDDLRHGDTGHPTPKQFRAKPSSQHAHQVDLQATPVADFSRTSATSQPKSSKKEPEHVEELIMDMLNSFGGLGTQITCIDVMRAGSEA